MRGLYIAPFSETNVQFYGRALEADARVLRQACLSPRTVTLTDAEGVHCATQLVRCRKCAPCLRVRQSEWMRRAVVEFTASKRTWWVTYTFRGSFDKPLYKQLQKTHKLLRKHAGPFGSYVPRKKEKKMTVHIYMYSIMMTGPSGDDISKHTGPLGSSTLDLLARLVLARISQSTPLKPVESELLSVTEANGKLWLDYRLCFRKPLKNAFDLNGHFRMASACPDGVLNVIWWVLPAGPST